MASPDAPRDSSADSSSAAHPSLTLDQLSVRGLRNLVATELEPSPRTNIVFGDNGQGKTSLLEAIYLVATSRSFRTARIRDVVAHGAATLSVRARFTERRGVLPPLERQQVLAFEGRTAHVKLDGNPADSLASYATKSPVVVFHPDELTLTTGPAAIRRRLLDRVALYVTPSAARASGAYTRALKARQELLRRGASEAELDAYEEVAARAGAELTRAREAAARELEGDIRRAFGEIGAGGIALDVRFVRGGSDDPAEARAELAARRAKDTRAPTATFGPHRDDLVLSLDGHLARGVASQGQHRALTLAIKAAESATVGRVTGLEPIQLLDDVSSELDPTRTDALFSHLARRRAQIFVTTTRPDVVGAALKDKFTKQYRMVEGALTEA